MKKIALLLTILLNVTFVNGQPFKLKDMDFIFWKDYIKLKEQHIDTIITYQQYYEGGMNFTIPSRCSGFVDAFILWKNRGEYYIKSVVCHGPASEKVIRIGSKPFDAYFKYLPISRRCEKYKYNAADILPLRDHDTFEQLTLLSPQINYQITITEWQKTSKKWQKYSWIRANLEIIRITRAEIDKAIGAGLIPDTLKTVSK